MSDPESSACPAPQCLCIDGSLDIGHAEELRERLTAALAVASSLEIDLQQVERADTAGLQLLLALLRTARDRNVAITWQAPSEALSNAAGWLGLGSALGFPESQNG